MLQIQQSLLMLVHSVKKPFQVLHSRPLWNYVITNNFKYLNTLIRKFPASIIASMNGFEKKPQFEAETGAERAPEVKF